MRRLSLVLALYAYAANGQGFPARADWAERGPGNRIWIAGNLRYDEPIPVSPNAYVSSCNPCGGFVARLAPDGSVERATYLPGRAPISQFTLGPDGTSYLAIQSSGVIPGSGGLSGSALLALAPDLDKLSSAAVLPEAFPRRWAVASDGSVYFATESTPPRLWRIRSQARAATIIAELTRSGVESVSVRSIRVSTDGDLWLSTSESQGAQFQTSIAKLSPDGQTERWRRALPGATGSLTPTEQGNMLDTTFDSRTGRRGLIRITSAGIVTTLADSLLAPIDTLYPTTENGPIWFTSRGSLETTPNATRHCRLESSDTAIGRWQPATGQIDYLSFIGETAARQVLAVWPRGDQADLLASLPSLRGTTRIETLRIAASPNVPFCIEPLIDNLPAAGRIIANFIPAMRIIPSTQPLPPPLLQTRSLAPGSFIWIPGRGLGPRETVRAPAGQPLPRQLGGLRLWIDGRPAALLAVRESGVEAVIPYAVNEGSIVPVAVESATSGRLSQSVNISIVDTNPSVFVGRASTGAFKADGSEVSETNPVKPGEAITCWVSGAGRYQRAFFEGNLPPIDEAQPVVAPLPLLRAPAFALITGFRAPIQALVEYAGPVLGQLPGLVQVNVRLPNDLPAGPQSLELRFVPIPGFPGFPGFDLAVSGGSRAFVPLFVAN